MPAGFLTVVLLVLLLVVAFQVIFSFNRDLFRVGAYKELGRKALPLAALVLMAATLPIVQTATAEWVPVAWAVTLGGGIILANFFSMPALERKASRQFRRGRHAEAAEGFRSLAEDKPLARYYAFLGAALGASEEKSGDSESPDSGGNGSKRSGSSGGRALQGSIDASTKAIELDPDYGVAYYNRALIHQRAGRRSKAAKDMQRALEADLPKRFRTAAKRYLEQR